MIIEKNLLDDEDGDCFAKLRSSLHYAKAQRYDLSREEEVDYIWGIIFDKGSDNAEGCQS